MSAQRTYTIEETAKAPCVSKFTILRRLQQGCIEEVRRGRNKWRVFTKSDVDVIKKGLGNGNRPQGICN